MTNLTESSRLGKYQDAVDAALAGLDEDRIISRIWDHDHTVWNPEPTEIANRLGWLHCVEEMEKNVQGIYDLVKEVREAGYTHALLLGMGGSSLAPEVFRKTFGVKDGHLDLAVLDSTDPGTILSHAGRLDPERTLFIVSTKSGGTVETLSFFKYFYNWEADALGTDSAGEHFIAITDPGSKLEKMAKELNFRKAFLNDPDIGGRYSVLSYFGMVPAALVGVDVGLLLSRVHDAKEQKAKDNPGAWLGAVLGSLAQEGRDKVTLISSSGIASFGDWVEQLVAESSGKDGQGILPVVGEPLAPPAAYGDDRLFVQLRLDGDDTNDEALKALEDAGHPVVRLPLQNTYDLGRQCFLWEMATAVACSILKVNPFDQPNVEAAKVVAREKVAEYAQKGELPKETPSLSDDGIDVYGQVKSDNLGEALEGFISRAGQGAYIALQAYVQTTSDTDKALLDLRRVLRDKTRHAVTIGYGPRFLHSTGQLHKGDAGNGLFIQFTSDKPKDTPIPDEPGSKDSSISFGVLNTAQAMGDREALANAGRKVIRLHLGPDVAGGIERVAKLLS